MPETPILLLPYPADPDPADIPADMGELALRVEAVRGAPNGLAGLDVNGQLPAAQRGPIGLVTALPAPTSDGQEVLLTDNLAVPGYMWRLRWNAADGRWGYVGGYPARHLVATQETTTSIGSMVNLATVGPRVTVPKQGDYSVRFGATVIDSAADSQIILGVGVGDFAAGAQLGEARGHISTANYHLTIVGEAYLVNVAAGAEIRVKYQHTIAGTLTVLNRYLYVTPARIIQ